MECLGRGNLLITCISSDNYEEYHNVKPSKIYKTHINYSRSCGDGGDFEKFDIYTDDELITIPEIPECSYSKNFVIMKE
jgi:hypothetical protein